MESVPFADSNPSIVPVPGLLEHDLQSARNGLMDFTSITSPERRRLWELYTTRDPKYDEPDDGVITKTGFGGSNKTYLHYRPDLPKLLKEKRGITLTPDERLWFGACDRIWHACTEAVLRVAEEMDTLLPGYDFLERVRVYETQHVLRVLSYKPRSNVLAEVHTDRSAFTLPLFQSTPGLYLKRAWGDQFLDVLPSLPQVVCFAGDQFECVTGGKIKSVRHGVADKMGGTGTRCSIVFFGKMFPGAFPESARL